MQVLVSMIHRRLVCTFTSSAVRPLTYVFLFAGQMAATGIFSTAIAAEAASAPVPAEQTAAAHRDPHWRVPHLSWGDPNLQGTFTSRDMSGIPMSRPKQYGTRRFLTAEEYQKRVMAGGGSFANQIKEAGPQENKDRLQLSALDSAEIGTRIFGERN